MRVVNKNDPDWKAALQIVKAAFPGYQMSGIVLREHCRKVPIRQQLEPLDWEMGLEKHYAYVSVPSLIIEHIPADKVSAYPLYSRIVVKHVKFYGRPALATLYISGLFEFTPCVAKKGTN